MQCRNFRIIIVLLCLCNPLSAQDYLGFNKDDIIADYNLITPSDSSFTFSFITKEDRLIVKMEGIDSLEATYFFTQPEFPEYEEATCDSIAIRLLCRKCEVSHKTEMIAKRERKWLLLPDSTYISKKWIGKTVTSGKSSVIYTIPVMKFVSIGDNSMILIYLKEFTKYERQEMLKAGTKP